MTYMDIEISLSGIRTGQKALKVTQNNIANADTEGYARQRMVVEELESYGRSGVDAQIGTGALVKKVERIVDHYLGKEVRNENSEVAYFKDTHKTLAEVEMMFSEHSDVSVSSMIASVFQAFEEASKYPEDIAYRQSLLGKTKQFTDFMNEMSGKFNELKSTLDDRVMERVDRVNELGEGLADINRRMSLLGTENPNVLLDERDRILQELSGFVEVNIDVSDRHIADVHIGDVLLVSEKESYPLKALFDSNTNEWMLSSKTVVVRPESGSLQAAIDLRNEKMSGYEQELNTWLNGFITEVNTRHNAGFGLDNSTGNDYFVGTTISSIGINPVIWNDETKIALSSVINTPGNSDVGKDVYGLKDLAIAGMGNRSLTESYDRFVFTIGNDVAQANSDAMVHENIYDTMNQQKESIQGVNIDEEMANLLQYQRYYQANAKMFSTLNKTFDAILDLL
jgi:flagellar hook-associated protein 1